MLGPGHLQVKEPIFDATYHNLGVRAPYGGDEDGDSTVSLRYRVQGSADWILGMPMDHDRRAQITGPNENLIANPYRYEHRASVLGLTPGTTYEVEITYQDPDGVDPGAIGDRIFTRTVTTRAEPQLGTGASVLVSPGSSISAALATANPGDTILVQTGTYQELVTAARSGVDGNLITLWAEPGVVIDATGNPSSCGVVSLRCGILVTGDYVRVRGFEITGARVGIRAYGASYGVIEGSHIHDVPFLGGTSVAVQIVAPQNEPARALGWTVQDNRLVAAPGDPAGQVIRLEWTGGGHVIRRNDIRFTHVGTPGVHGSDCFGGYPNQGPWGVGPNVDVYENLCVGATDDGIEFDGSAMNARYYKNTVRGSTSGFSAAPIDVGPAYLFRNTVHDLRIHWTTSCVGIKTGEGKSLATVGKIYVWNNTFYLPDPMNQCGGLSAATQSGGGGVDAEMDAWNNGFHGRERSVRFNSPHAARIDNNIHWDEDQVGALLQWWIGGVQASYNTLAAFRTATGQEQAGIEVRPIYANEVARDLRIINGPHPQIRQGFNDRDGAIPIGAY